MMKDAITKELSTVKTFRNLLDKLKEHNTSEGKLKVINILKSEFDAITEGWVNNLYGHMTFHSLVRHHTTLKMTNITVIIYAGSQHLESLGNIQIWTDDDVIWTESLNKLKQLAQS